MPRIALQAIAILFVFMAELALAAEQIIRPAAVAGSWYPGDKTELADSIDALLARAKPHKVDQKSTPIRALIAPHAGYLYSGATAADGYRALLDARYQRVIVLGSAHRAYFRGISIAEVSHYQTPLGLIPLDKAAVTALRASPLIHSLAHAHRQEHSIEMQLPFLQRSLKPGWTLLPLLLGDMSEADYQQAAALLRPLFDAHTLIVVSSDFTHYGERFSYQPFALDKHTPARLEQLDKGALASILAKDAAAFLRYQQDTGVTVCGFRPIALLLRLLPADAQGEWLSYATSGELTGDYAHSVSYLSILFHEGRNASADEHPNDELSDADMQWLHQLAVRTVVYAVDRKNEDALSQLSQWLESAPASVQKASGAFVTLKKHGALRGCIGYIQPRKPLFQAVTDNSVNAALHDQRFAPLTANELADLEIEVSVLTPPQSVPSYEHFDVGEEGVILQKNGRSAVFLPEVATEQGWNREQTLTRLARKAGLSADAWRQDAEFRVFRSQKISAPMPE